LFLVYLHKKVPMESYPKFQNLRAEIERDMKLMGCQSVDQLSPRQFEVQMSALTVLICSTTRWDRRDDMQTPSIPKASG
jgi:hypothetical protein